MQARMAEANGASYASGERVLHRIKGAGTVVIAEIRGGRESIFVNYDSGASGYAAPEFLAPVGDAVVSLPRRIPPRDRGRAPKVRSNKAELKPVTATPYVWKEPSALPTREWLYGRHLIRKFVSTTIAPGGIGKTSLGIAETLAMVTGRDLLGMTIPYLGPLRVWYLNLEDPRDEIDRQVQAAAIHYGLTAQDIGDRLFADSGREQRFVVAEQDRDGATICVPVVDSIISELRSRRIDCIHVDPFVSSHQVSENDNGAMDLVVKEWGRIADAANCAVHLIHHTRKMQGDIEVTAESSRGGKSLTDGGRSIRVLNRMTKEEAEQAGVLNHRLYFRAHVDKGNLAPPVEKSDWFHLVGTSLGNGRDGRPSDEIGVVTRWTWPDPFHDVGVDDLRLVQNKVMQGVWKASVQAKNWVGYAVAEAMDIDISEPAAKAKVRSLIKEWLKNGALVEVRRQDEYRRQCPFIEAGALVE